MSRAQARAIDELGAKYLLKAEQPIDAAATFGRKAPLMLEIGFGTGTALIAFAETNPHFNCLGMEVFEPSIGNTLKKIHARSLDNVRLVAGDARTALAKMIRKRSLSEVHIYFPDPWPKKRHHKRRLVNADFVDALASHLRAGGRLCLATDDAGYARSMLTFCDAHAQFINEHGHGQFAPHRGTRPETRFERRGLALGNEIFDLSYRRGDNRSERERRRQTD